MKASAVATALGASGNGSFADEMPPSSSTVKAASTSDWTSAFPLASVGWVGQVYRFWFTTVWLRSLMCRDYVGTCPLGNCEIVMDGNNTSNHLSVPLAVFCSTSDKSACYLKLCEEATMRGTS